MLPPSVFSKQLYVVFFVFGLFTSTLASAASVGDFIPEFELQSSNQKKENIKDYRGKLMFINFWASWCTPCRKELPLLSQLQDRNKDLVVLAINIDSEYDNATDFLDRYPFSGVVMFDQEARVVDQFKAQAMPTSYIVDRSGKIRFVHYGFDKEKDPQKWDEEVRRLLDEV